MALPPGLHARGGRASVLQDPLRHRRHSSKGAREFFHAVCHELEGLLRSGNGAGKTDVGAALAVAFAQCRPEIDDRTIYEALTPQQHPLGQGQPYRPFKMPPIRSPNVGLILVKGLKESIEACVAAMKKYIGNYPHKVIPSTTPGAIAGWYIKPWDSRSDDYKNDWSRIYLLPEGGNDPAGGRYDWVWADEPPNIEFWRELRQRGRALNAPFFSWITMTPKDQEDWFPIRQDFDGCLYRARGGRYEVVITVFDNQALTEEDKIKRVQKAKGDPHEVSRLFGEYVDVSGTNPLRPWADELVAERKIAETIIPDLVPVEVESKEIDEETGRPYFTHTDQYKLEIFEEYDPLELYFMVIDCSIGVKDEKGEHSPAEIYVGARGRALADGARRPVRTVARFNDYVSGYTLGGIAAFASRLYRHPPYDVDDTGGYGQACIDRMIKLGCPPPLLSPYLKKPGTLIQQRGFVINESQHGGMLSAMQRMLTEMREARAAGLPSPFQIRSKDAVNCLLSLQVDKHGKLKQGAGRKTESYVTMSRFLFRHYTEDLPGPAPERRATPQDLINRELGRAPRTGRRRARPRL